MKPGTLFVPILANGGGVNDAYMHAFFDTFRCMENVTVDRMVHSHIGRARNNAAAAFLRGECEWLLFIDADIVFTLSDIELLMESHDEVVTGIYYYRSEIATIVCNPVPGEKPRADGFIDVLACGAGFLRIHRTVFERIITACPELEYDEAAGAKWDFFSSGVVNRSFMQEDQYFCHRWRSLGGHVWADPRIQLIHNGTQSWPKKIVL